MIRTTAVPRPVRSGAALIGVAGMLALAGCATATTSGGAAATYKNGTYTGQGSYATPESVEQISVTVTLVDNVITTVDVVGEPQKADSKEYQAKFIGGISDLVVGKNINEISVSRVAGSSLTSGGFNKAIDQIRAEAAG